MPRTAKAPASDAGRTSDEIDSLRDVRETTADHGTAPQKGACAMTAKAPPADVDVETEAMYAKHDMALRALLAEALSQIAFKEVDMPVPLDVEMDAWQAVERICWNTRDRLTAITEAHYEALKHAQDAPR